MENQIMVNAIAYIVCYSRVPNMYLLTWKYTVRSTYVSACVHRIWEKSAKTNLNLVYTKDIGEWYARLRCGWEEDVVNSCDYDYKKFKQKPEHSIVVVVEIKMKTNKRRRNVRLKVTLNFNHNAFRL